MPRKPDPLFRRATSNDIPAMSRIRLSVTENTLSDPTRITHAMYEDFLDVSGRGWVAEIDGEIVAFCYADKVDASIWALFVSPGHEGRGFGQALLELAVDWLFALGHETIHLSTGADTRADRFYARQGWTRGPLSAGNIGYTLRRAGPSSERPPACRSAP
jgi:GNAT superfamily N-acetyltransferase